MLRQQWSKVIRYGHAMIHGHIEDKKHALTPAFHWMVSAKVGGLGIAAVLNIDAEAHTAHLMV